MKVYHGTGIKNNNSIIEDGFIKEDCYFGSIEIAIEYAESFGDGVIFEAELSNNDFMANMTLNNHEYEEGDTDVELEEDDIIESLEMYDSVISKTSIFDFNVIDMNRSKEMLKEHHDKKPIFKTLSKNLLVHLGTMDINNKKKDSYEGDGVSVSVNPKEWRRIAQLEGAEFILKNKDSKMADFYSMDNDQLNNWGVDNNYIAPCKGYRVQYFDDELDRDVYSDYLTPEDAFEEAEAMGMEQGDVLIVNKYKPTKKMLSAISVSTDHMQYDRHLFGLYVQENNPDHDGVWFADKLDVLGYSAPAGMIFKNKLDNWEIKEYKNDRDNEITY
jgi:hypothetical protein